MYRYLHVQAQPVMTGLSAAMLRGGSFRLTPSKFSPSLRLWIPPFCLWPSGTDRTVGTADTVLPSYCGGGLV